MVAGQLPSYLLGLPTTAAAANDMTASFPSYDFSTHVVGTTSGAITLQFTNTGTVTVQSAVISVQGPDAGDFGTSGTSCNGTITPGGTCFFFVRFHPTSFGPKSVTIRLLPGISAFTSDVVSIAGTGVAGTVQLGQVAPAQPNPPPGNGCTGCSLFQRQSDAASPSYAAPADGTITSWSVQGPSDVCADCSVKLRIFRQTGPGQYVTVADSAVQLVDTGLKTFSVSIAVRAGDILGIDATNGIRWYAGSSGDHVANISGDPTPGSTTSVCPSTSCWFDSLGAGFRTNVAATLVETAPLSTDHALHFNGIASYDTGSKAIADSAAIHSALAYDFTIDTWVKWDGAGGYVGIVSLPRGIDGESGTGITLALSDGVPWLAMQDAGGQRFAIATTALTPHRWTHVVASYDGRVTRITTDGANAGGQDYGSCMFVPSTTNPLLLGTEFQNVGGLESRHFGGAIDALIIKQGAVSPTYSCSPVSSGPSVSWSFDEGVGTVARTSTGGAADAVLYNGVTWVAGHTVKPVISGTVRDDLGQPVANARVAVQVTGSGTAEGTTSTDASGSWSLPVTSVQSYWVSFTPPTGTHLAPQFYSDAISSIGATPVAVSDTDVSGINAALHAGYALSGRVFDAVHAPVAGAVVEIYQGDACCGLVAAVQTNADGSYSIDLAANYDYRMRARTATGELWWNGVSNPQNAVQSGWDAATPFRMETATGTCRDTTETILVNTWNTGGVSGGGQPKPFTTPTLGRWCITEADTYHLATGAGALGGTITLRGPSTLALTAPIVPGATPGYANWGVRPSSGSAVILGGAYTCDDSDPSTWAQDAASAGFGFCKIQGVPYDTSTVAAARPNMDFTLGSAISGIARCGTLTATRASLFSGSTLLAVRAELSGGAFAFPGTAPSSKYKLAYSGIRFVSDRAVPFSCSVVVTTDAAGNAVAPAGALITDLGNHTWTTALRMPLAYPNGMANPAVTSQVDYVFKTGQSNWYKVHIEPGQKVLVKLTGNGSLQLPADFSLALFKDIKKYLDNAKAAVDPASGDPLQAVKDHDAATAPDALSPDALSPDALSPDALSPDALSPDALSPDALSPDELSPDELSPDELSPDALSPDAYSPDALSPDALSPDALSPDAYSGAQSATILRVSAHSGTSPEQLIQNTWTNAGDFYVRVRGHNGAFDASTPFLVTVEIASTACTGAPLASYTATPLGATVPAQPTTVIVTNTARFGAPVVATYSARLNALAAATGGVVIDLATNAGIQGAYAQWDARATCPAAANAVAEAIKPLIDGLRSPALKYIVLAGGDHVVPYFRTPDQAGLGNEQGFAPGLLQDTPGEASLKFGYTLTQDFYGTRAPIAHFDHRLFIPDLAVGRLVESSSDIVAVITAYLASGGVAHVAGGRALDSGYDFLSDTATFVQTSLAQSLTVQTLIQQRHATTPPTIDPAWTADQLRAQLFARHYDILALNGHFSANTLLAADFATRITSDEIAANAALFTNSLIISTGCHSGFNIVDPEAKANTNQVDWAQAFARAGAQTIGSTGYAYGDTDFMKYTELIVGNFTTELRYGAPNEAVAIGTALVNAKRAYAGSVPALRGIDEKALMEATLYGLPMWSIDLGANGRLARPGTGNAINPTDLGGGLSSATVSPSYDLHRNPPAGNPVTGVYWDANGNVSVSPATPVLPLTNQSVGVAGINARGVVLMDATYADEGPVTPFTDVAGTELAGLHAGYSSPVFAPVRPFALNALSGGTTLVTTPAQFKSTGANSGTIRRWTSESFQVFYSSRTDPVAALAGSPVVYSVQVAQGGGNTVHFTLTSGALADPGFSNAYLTYTSETGPLHGTWHSVPMTFDPLADLVTGNAVTRTFTADVNPGGAPLGDVRAFVQVVGGNGLVSMNTNDGEYYRFVAPSTATIQTPKQSTVLAISAPASAAYLGSATVKATLTGAGAGLGGLPVTITLGGQRADVLTNASGIATVTFTVRTLPGDTTITAGFAEDATHLAAGTEAPFHVARATATLDAGAPTVQYTESEVVATLSLGGASDPQSVTLTANGKTISVLSDALGRIRLDARDLLLPGANAVTIAFDGNDRFAPISLTRTITMTAEDATLSGLAFDPAISGPLTVSVNVAEAADGTPGDLTKAIVTFVLRHAGAQESLPAPVSATGVATVTFADVGTTPYTVDATVTGGYYSSSTESRTDPALVLSADASGTYLDTTTVSARLSGPDGGLGGLPVTLSLGAQTAALRTDQSGNVTTTFTITAAPGNTTVRAAYAGDATHLPAAVSRAFVVQKARPTLTALPATIQYTEGAIIANLALSGTTSTQTVTLAAGGTTITRTTDASGNVQLDTRDLPLLPGANTVTVGFPGNDFYLAGTIPVAVTLTAEDATITLPALAPTPIGSLSLTGQVTEVADGTPGSIGKAQVSYVLRNEAGTVVQTIVVNATPSGAAPVTFLNVAANVYHVEASVVGGYYSSPANPVTYAIAVVYDTSTFVTGGGWLNTTTASTGLPAGRKATFGFVSKYLPGRSTPSGAVEVNIDRSFNFVALPSFDWMVSSGGRAEIQGMGSVNRASGYSFRLTATDGGSTDTFDLRIWNTTTSPASSFDAPLYKVSGVIVGGNIVVH